MAGVKRPRGIDYSSSAATAVFLFGEENARRLAEQLGSEKALDYRKILEATPATTQCDNAIRPFEEKIECYLCGIPLSKMGKQTRDETYPECEHIMPLVQARWYNLAYYTGRKVSGVDMMNYEYAWAHKCCNGAKLTDLFISYPDETGKVSIQESVIDMVLFKAKARAKSKNPGKTNPELFAIQNINSKERKDFIIRTYLQPLVTWINRIPHTVPGSANLLTLTGAASLIDPATRPKSLRGLEETLFLTQEELARIKEKEVDRAFIAQYVEKVINERVAERLAAKDLIDFLRQRGVVRRPSVIATAVKGTKDAEKALIAEQRKAESQSAAEQARAAVALSKAKKDPAIDLDYHDPEAEAAAKRLEGLRDPKNVNPLAEKFSGYDEQTEGNVSSGGRRRRRKTRRVRGRGRRSPLHKNVLHTTLRGRRK
jgi:hypothetical protein